MPLFNDTKKQQAYETEKNALIKEFGEKSDRLIEKYSSPSAGDQLEGLITEKLKGNTALTYGAAFTEVMGENPVLTQEYQRSLNQ